MAELLALPAVAPVALPPGLLDDAGAAAPVLAADPFAVFMANAEVAMPAKAVPLPIASPALPMIAQQDPAIPVDIATHVSNGDAPDKPDDGEAPAIDPTLSPALALLAALVTPKADAPRIVTPAPSRATIAAVAPQQARPAAARLPLPLAGGKTDGAQAAAALQPQAPLPLAGLIGSGHSDLPIPVAVLAEAAPLLVKQTATELPEPVETEAAVAAEVIASTDAPPAPPKARLLPPAAPRNDAAIFSATTRHADRAEQAPATPLRVAGRDQPRLDIPVPPVATPVVDTAHADIAAPVPATDQLVQRQLVIADDGRWLDSLARDISQSASGDTLRFKLEPVNLGSLTVAIAQGSDGAAIRLTAETHRARDLLVDAQPALVAEARANGLRISETHVDLGDNRSGSGNAPSGGQPSLANSSTGQQAMRQDARRQPDLPTATPNQPRSTATRAPARDSGERFA